MAGAVLRGLQELGGQLVQAGTYQQLARAAQRTVRGGGGDAFIMLNVLDALPVAHRGAPESQRYFHTCPHMSCSTGKPSYLHLA